MNKRNAALGVMVAVVVAALVGYPYYFDWWDHKSCAESGGTWNEAQDECIEPLDADIPDTGKSLHSQPDEGARRQ
jgi:hypothetical protein